MNVEDIFKYTPFFQENFFFLYEVFHRLNLSSTIVTLNK